MAATATDKPRRTARAINKAGTSISSTTIGSSLSAAEASTRAGGSATKKPASKKKATTYGSWWCRVTMPPWRLLWRGIAHCVDSDDGDDDAEALLAKVDDDKRRINSKRKRGAPAKTAILDEFMSLDALLDNDLEEKRKKQARERKLQKLRDECDTSLQNPAFDGASPLGKLMNAMESNMTSLSADNHLFTDELPKNQERFGYVFSPITEPLPYRRYEATPAELNSELKLVYKAMESNDANEIGALLWSKAILLRCVLAKDAKTSDANGPALPAKIGAWLFSTSESTAIYAAGLPSAAFCYPNEDYRVLLGSKMTALRMEWQPTVYDFLNAFRTFGFQDSKRSMSAKSKIDVTPKSTSEQKQKAAPILPFPALNMEFVLLYFVLCLRAKILKLDGYDAFSFTMFFLRMQFEQNMHPEIVQLASICIEELLEVFPTMEWRKEWAPSLVLRIAGVNEGLFDSATGWLTVARRLPRTIRGTQLTTGLSIYVLQHRIDRTPQEGSNSERPLKFPIQSGLVLDIVAGIVEDLTLKYTEKRQSGKASKTPPPYDLLCKKVALMDLALQAFLNILTQKEMSLLLKKLDALTGSHKSTMSAKWHEVSELFQMHSRAILKTLVSLMHRKYSLENLRIGREASPPSKTTLFVGDTN
ncbi:hypothetical protein FI667_g224, partial [Globisporangium splendens]